ncbi:MAG TPA: endonuclease/exonuclease/phosphatase family protein, partial [Bacillota bacterium]|nr:endonuclease/exonuclease/phosphatase family protein [Bacillota bacterium]
MRTNKPEGTHSKLTLTQRVSQRVRRALAGLLVLTTLGAAASTVLAGPGQAGSQSGFETMTVNLYLGGDVGTFLTLNPATPDYFSNLVATVTSVYDEIVASQPAVRMQGVADEIVARMPDVVAVEEASLLRNQSPGDLVAGGTQGATNVVFDYLQLLTDALAARGAHYRVAVISQEIDLELPMSNLQTGTLDDVRLTDREAILVRTDLPPGQLQALNPQHGNFSHIIQIPGTGVSVPRGWCSVDVSFKGQSFRYICTHLEEETVPLLQILQAQELLRGPAASRLPVLLCGDFNADPLHRDGSVAYDLFTRAGFNDAWTATHPADPAGGLTWGHDALLADPSHAFDRRIDLIFFRGVGITPIQTEVVDIALDRSEPPLWATDHAAVDATLFIQRTALGSRGHGGLPQSSLTPGAIGRHGAQPR